MKLMEETSSRIRAGALVVATLHEPREKYWGILDSVTGAGVYLRGLDLQTFEDVMRAVRSGEAVFGIGEVFFPLWRVERLALDTPSGTIPSLAEQFANRTGYAAEEIFHFSATLTGEDEITDDAPPT
jgi:hypothetical protein